MPLFHFTTAILAFIPFILQLSFQKVQWTSRVLDDLILQFSPEDNHLHYSRNSVMSVAR